MLSYYKDKKKIYFSKMHGLGNDFVVINCIKKKLFLSANTIKKLSNRYTGIGFDQLLFLEKSHHMICDFHYRIFNSNGKEVEQCGNGARCFGLFAILKNLTKKKTIVVSTKRKNLIITCTNKNMIQVNMHEPIFISKEFPLLKKHINQKFCVTLSKKLPYDSLICNVVSIGNPHCIIYVQCIKNAPVCKIGEKIAQNITFPEGINVNFMQIVNKSYIKLRVYERGVGETQACGSGACAAVAMGIKEKLLDKEVTVELLGGKLLISWKGLGDPLYMTGPAEHVYDGCIYI